MTIRPLSAMTPASALTGAEILYLQQAGADVKATIAGVTVASRAAAVSDDIYLSDFGVLADNATDNATALMNMRLALIGTNKPHWRIHAPPGGTILYSNNRWLYGVSRFDLYGNGSTFRAIYTVPDISWNRNANPTNFYGNIIDIEINVTKVYTGAGTGCLIQILNESSVSIMQVDLTKLGTRFLSKARAGRGVRDKPINLLAPRDEIRRRHSIVWRPRTYPGEPLRGKSAGRRPLPATRPTQRTPPEPGPLHLVAHGETPGFVNSSDFTNSYDLCSV